MIFSFSISKETPFEAIHKGNTKFLQDPILHLIYMPEKIDLENPYFFELGEIRAALTKLTRAS